MPVVVERSERVELLARVEKSGHLSTALPRAADDCYDLFCDVARIPEWLSVVRTATVVRRDQHERPSEVAFLARLERATVGYTCHYRYEPGRRRVDWSTAPGARLRVAGAASFQPLGDKTCLMTYQLDLDVGALPAWNDPMFESHAPSASLLDFRDFVLRVL